MAEIEISMSRKNLRQLVLHAFIGNWILESHNIKPNEESEAFFNAVLAIGKTYNVMDGIEYDEKTGEFELTRDREEELMRPIERYDEDTFWEELVDRLAVRDAVEKCGEDEFGNLEAIERMKSVSDEEEKYDAEFETHGVARLRIVAK